jgi:hypothetical protein
LERPNLLAPALLEHFHVYRNREWIPWTSDLWILDVD